VVAEIIYVIRWNCLYLKLSEIIFKVKCSHCFCNTSVLCHGIRQINTVELTEPSLVDKHDRIPSRIATKH
jgi:hypothetical protein